MNRTPWLLPIAIVVAGALIGVTLYVIRSGTSHPLADLGALRPVTSSDHIVGNPDAQVVIVEYADMDSSYSAQFAQALEQLMADEGTSGRVAWVFRHFPNAVANSDAVSNAEAAECVGALGGNTLFFRFIDAVYAASAGAGSVANYGPIVTSLGISDPDFESCMAAHTYKAHVADDFANAIAIGADGSPYSVLLASGKKPVPISGALPYDALKKIVESSLTTAP